MKSREYIERALAEGRAEFEYDEVLELNTLEVMKHMINERANLEQGVSLFNNDNCFAGEVKYDPNVDFNYFATTSSIHDGTLLFMLETAADVLNKVFKLQTCNKRIIKPELVNEKLFDKYYFSYTIGDIVIFCDDSLGDGKEKTIATLPIKFNVFQKKRGM